MAVKQALDNKEIIDDITKPSTFLAFYVDLKTLVGPSAHKEAARAIQQGAAPDLAARVDATFAKASDSFQVRAVEDLRAAYWSRLEVEFRLWLAKLRGPEADVRVATSDTFATPSIERHLERFLDAAKSFQQVNSATSLFRAPHGCIPVLIVDEVHLLDDPSLLAIRHEFVAFILEHVSAKSMAPVVIVLLSSDATAPRIIGSWGGKYDLRKLFYPEVVGDVRKVELNEFITSLPKGDAKSKSGGLQRWSDRIADPSRFDQAFSLYGGFANDWIRLHDAQLLTPDSDVVLTDMSKVNSLANAANVTQLLSDMGLDPADVLQTFRAITESKMSPRGAVLRHALEFNHSGHSVPFAALLLMSENNLIEIRNGNPNVLDYHELAPYAHKVYVCATSPLTRTSMAKVVRLLAEEEERRKAEVAKEEERKAKQWRRKWFG